MFNIGDLIHYSYDNDIGIITNILIYPKNTGLSIVIKWTNEKCDFIYSENELIRNTKGINCIFKHYPMKK